MNIVPAIAVLDAPPLIESVLLQCFLPQVPLPIVGTVVVVGQHLSERWNRWIEKDVVLLHVGRVRIEPGQKRGSSGCANGLGAVGMLEHEASLRYVMEGASLQPVGPIA